MRGQQHGAFGFNRPVRDQQAARASKEKATRQAAERFFGTTVGARRVAGREHHPVGVELEAQHVFEREQRRLGRVGRGGHGQRGLVEVGQIAGQQAVRGEHHHLLARELARAAVLQHRGARGGRAQDQVFLGVGREDARELLHLVAGFGQRRDLAVVEEGVLVFLFDAGAAARAGLDQRAHRGVARAGHLLAARVKQRIAPGDQRLRLGRHLAKALEREPAAGRGHMADGQVADQPGRWRPRRGGATHQHRQRQLGQGARSRQDQVLLVGHQALEGLQEPLVELVGAGHIEGGCARAQARHIERLAHALNQRLCLLLAQSPAVKLHLALGVDGPDISALLHGQHRHKHLIGPQLLRDVGVAGRLGLDQLEVFGKAFLDARLVVLAHELQLFEARAHLLDHLRIAPRFTFRALAHHVALQGGHLVLGFLLLADHLRQAWHIHSRTHRRIGQGLLHRRGIEVVGQAKHLRRIGRALPGGLRQQLDVGLEDEFLDLARVGVLGKLAGQGLGRGHVVHGLFKGLARGLGLARAEQRRRIQATREGGEVMVLAKVGQVPVHRALHGAQSLLWAAVVEQHQGAHVRLVGQRRARLELAGFAVDLGKTLDRIGPAAHARQGLHAGDLGEQPGGRTLGQSLRQHNAFHTFAVGQAFLELPRGITQPGKRIEQALHLVVGETLRLGKTVGLAQRHVGVHVQARSRLVVGQRGHARDVPAAAKIALALIDQARQAHELLAFFNRQFGGLQALLPFAGAPQMVGAHQVVFHLGAHHPVLALAGPVDAAPLGFDQVFRLVEQLASFFQVAVVDVVVGHGGADAHRRRRVADFADQFMADRIGLGALVGEREEVAQTPACVRVDGRPVAQDLLLRHHIAQAPGGRILELVELDATGQQAVGIDGSVDDFAQPLLLLLGQLQGRAVGLLRPGAAGHPEPQRGGSEKGPQALHGSAPFNLGLSRLRCAIHAQPSVACRPAPAGSGGAGPWECWRCRA